MKRLQILITLLLTVGFAIGQTVYPIRTFTVVNAPAPYALSGFASEPGRVQLNILTDDIALDRYAVKFRLTIQGNGLKLFTKPDFHQQPFYLDGGVTQTLTGLDLEALFNPDNLVFEGYSASEYRRNGRLPEGVYRVWVDLLDYYRGMQVSQSLPGMAMIYLTRAPRLSFPLPGTEIDPLVEPNIRFAWMGSLPADPLADVVYQFRLWEIHPEGRDPYEVVAVSSPLFTQEVENPKFIYDMGMPPLTDGMTYVWQVRALDREGRALFQNSGLSNASTFRYGRSCPVPDVAITSVTHTSASVKWQGSQAAQLYRISYRPTRDSNWQHAETTASTHTFNNLADNTPYEVMVQAVCNGQEGDPGRVVGFKTTRQVDYTCGGKGGQFDLSNREPLPSLSRFDEFKAADFIVEVDEVMGQDGRFSGSGFALVPYLGFAKFMVTFNNIFVNVDRRMTQGHIQFVVNDTTGLVLGLGTGKGNGNNGTGTTEVDPGTIADEVYTVDGDVTNITVTGNTVTVTNGDGTTQTIVVKDGNTVAVVPSSGGTVYVADQATGSVYTTPKTQAGGGKPGSVGTPSQTGQYNCGIDFKAPKQMRFGHDPVGIGKTKPDAYFRTNASGSRVGWKSLRAGDTDIIDLVPRGGCQADSLRYLRTSGLATPTAPQGKGHRLLLGGLAAGDEDMLTVAVAKTQHVNDTTKREILTEAGALGLVAYDQIRKRVILVKVNGSRMPDVVTAIRDSLNAHYKPAVVEWTVDVNGSAVTVPSITPEGFKTAGSGLFARYTSDMRKVINAFEQQHGAIGKDDLCLFFVDVADQSRDGFMPLDGQYGFIFNFNNDPATVAHELAHGAFNLRHTFSSKAQHYLPEKTTHNLLDYANGTELWKYQWDLIHNPETILLGFMQDESEGAKEAMPLLNVAWTKASVPDGLFLSPGGMPIGLTGITELAFLKSAESGIDSRTVLKSVLYGFAKGEQRYFANFNGGRFTGYFLEGTTSEKEVFTDTEGVTKKIVQSGRYDVTLLGIDGEALSTRQVDNNLWYDQPDWRNYTAQGPQLTIIDDYTFMPCGNLLRQYKDSPLMESHVLKTAILNNPCVLKNPTLHFGSYVPESQWMKDFNMVFGTMVNVAFFPAAMEVAGGILLNEAKDRLAKAAVASAIDGTLQSVCIYLEAEEGDDWQSLCGQYDVKQMMVSALEGAVDNVYTDLTVPLYDSFFKDGKPKENLDIASFLKDYGFGVTVNLLTRGATDGYFSKYYKRMVAAAKKGNLENKLAKIGLSAENRKAFIDLMGGMTQRSLQRLDALSQKLRTFPVDGTATDLSRFADELDAVADHYPKKSLEELVAAFGCFTAATPVATPSGLRPIADIQTGDTVMSYNHTAQCTEPRVVANLKNYAAKALVILSLSTGQQIEATPTHPFYANGRYTPASQLAPGDSLTAPNGHKVLLQAVQPLDTVATVYNLTVAHNSNYYVGNPGVLVHNDCMMALLNAPIYKSLVDKLDKLTPELKAAFMADFEKAGKELLDVLNSPNGIEAWTMLNGLNYKLLKKNKQVLENLSQLLSNSAIDKSKLEQAIVNAYTSKLKGFGVDGLLDALATFKNTPGIGKLINDIGSEYGNFRKGAAFVLQKAKSLGADAVERFEEPIEIIVGKVRRYDMMLKGGKRVECKAWSNFYESTIKKQFLEGDLCSVEKFEDIRYFVDESSMSLDTWFEHMSKFMTDNADEIWDEKKYEGVRNLFTNIANNQYGINIENVDDLKDFVVKNRDKWFDIVFKQEL